MASQQQTHSDLHSALSTTDSGVKNHRLIDDATRLWKRVNRFISMGLGGSELDRSAMELACYAFQLPMKSPKPSTFRQTGVGLRERGEQAAELLIGGYSSSYDANVIERTAGILRDLHKKNPENEETKLLADAINLDDFGAIGFVICAMNLAGAHGSIAQHAESFEKRELYGYWSVRLKDTFHFPMVRDMANKRLESTRTLSSILNQELHEEDL